MRYQIIIINLQKCTLENGIKICMCINNLPQEINKSTMYKFIFNILLLICFDFHILLF